MSGWLCTRCNTANDGQAERCSNARCQLAFKVAGVSLDGQSEAAGGRSRRGRIGTCSATA